MCLCAGACHQCTFDCVFVCTQVGDGASLDDGSIFLIIQPLKNSANRWCVIAALKRLSSDSCCNTVTQLLGSMKQHMGRQLNPLSNE